MSDWKIKRIFNLILFTKDTLSIMETRKAESEKWEKDISCKH